jgi:hypothetical protein
MKFGSGLFPKYDSSKAIKELGMPQTRIEDAVKRAIGWFTKYRYL